MNDTMTQVGAEEHIRRLEEALAEYSVRYGITERARALFAHPWPQADSRYSGARVNVRAATTLSGSGPQPMPPMQTREFCPENEHFATVVQMLTMLEPDGVALAAEY